MNIFENLTAFPQFRVIFTLKKQDYSCSTVSLHKPCSVLQWSGSHLSAFFQTPHRMISLHLRQVPLPNLGFFLAEFTSFQLIFRLEQFLWHFIAYQPYLCLGLRPVVSSRYHDLLIRHVQTLQASQLVEAWTFLYFCSNRFLRVFYILLIFKKKTSLKYNLIEFL